ncbi:tRNA wybutosine-synthesizing protein 2 homolog isoform X2 [Entelurus aequoreus]|uniref:tRNA wybutosine-synthesizing protein 2 homolog isoform X2 n=1 Tax=Entelurus aequoreus TaxID=161455 RepID=UPI002B1E7214|nr:tRNA wybutosine-synthesizing protein 2 homolog isoform X2 [Entelurus aequoreus]
MDAVPCLRVPKCDAQEFRQQLLSRTFLDRGFGLVKEPTGTVLLPIVPWCLPQVDVTPPCLPQVDVTPPCLPQVDVTPPCLPQVDVTPPCLPQVDVTPPGSSSQLVWCQSSLLKKKEKGRRRGNKLEEVLLELLESHGERWTEELRVDLPRSFQRHGDLVLLGHNCFLAPPWKKIDKELWRAVAKGLGAKRLARMSGIRSDGYRSPKVTMLLGEHSWVKHVDNGITYEFDVTKCMFSAGNISEKLRVAGFDCRGETVVDLYAGIGYFTLPYLVHAGAAHVHACEWNPHAVRALHKNLVMNGVHDRCTVHPEDNRQVQLGSVADRVNLGLIPTSEDGWPVACRLLKKTTGGILHIHQNVTWPGVISDEWGGGVRGEREAGQAWAADAASRVGSLLKEVTSKPWTTSIRHIEAVKSYAPHVHHVVLDLECRPS